MAWVRMLWSLYARAEHEVQLYSPTVTMPRHGGPHQAVCHCAGSGPGARPDTVHLLAGGALQEGAWGVGHEGRQTGRVKGMFAVTKAEYRGQGGVCVVAGGVRQV